jgi:hypothetical protein
MTGEHTLIQKQPTGLEVMKDQQLHERGMLERIDHPEPEEIVVPVLR